MALNFADLFEHAVDAFGARTAAAPAAPDLRGLVEIDDGTDAQAPERAADHNTALAVASPERDFPARSDDDVYVIYTGGTTGYPKGVMWRHEDIWRTLAGGIDFVTSEPLQDEWAQSRQGLENGEFVKLCAAPLIYGNAQVAALAGLFAGETIVLLPAFDAREIWRAIERHQVNVLVIIGDAMARPLVEAYLAGDYDASSLLAVSSSAALFSSAVKDACAKALPDVVITEAIGSTETGFTETGFTETGFVGISFVSAGEPHRGGPTVMAGPDVIVLDEGGGRAGPGQVGRLARGGHVPLGYYSDPEPTEAMFAEVNGKRYAVPGDLARVEGALKCHPHGFDALVIGVPDDQLGQRVAALVQPRPGAVPDLAALAEHVRGQIAGYKVPRSLWRTDAISRTVSGQADYGWARQYAAGHPPGLDGPIGHPASAAQ